MQQFDVVWLLSGEEVVVLDIHDDENFEGEFAADAAGWVLVRTVATSEIDETRS